MKYAIENINGQWWNGKQWSVKEAREEYTSKADLPEVVGPGTEKYCYDINPYLMPDYYIGDDVEPYATVEEVK